MAFHVACPITCRKICFCIAGTPAPLVTRQGRDSFLQDVTELEKLLAKPAFLAAGGEETVEVLVPRLAKDLKGKKGKYGTGQAGGESGEDTPISKKAVMRKRATMAAIAVAEAAALAEQAKKAADAARFGHMASGATMNGVSGQVTCEICFYSEVAGSRRAERLMPCPNCKRVFHRNCLKRWAGNRDLFNWSSWVCGACRICEVCRRTGEPNKLMFCKRCDGAIHAYCQQPPLKHVPKGPFLCPKHTLCHGCGSRVPGSGVSSRWFLEYTMCDACGRLFIKGKYCSICLKVYRDSEASPMVCCDNCEHWVHARCDNISDEKYYEFQLDNNLHYTCAACRGDCYKVKGTNDAVEELWRRRDAADRDLILENQAAAGLPSKDENMKLCPSDDEDEHKDSEANLSKKTAKLLTVKGKDQDGKPFTNVESQKRVMEEVDTSGGSGVIKRLKITLPSSNTSKSKDLHHYKGDTEVLAPYIKAEEFSSHTKNPIKSVKFVDNAKAAKEATNFLSPQAEKSGVSKPGMKISPMSATTDYVRESQSPSEESRSDEDGSDRNSDFSQELRDRHFDEAGRSQSTHAGHGWDYPGDSSKHRLPSFKYRDKNQKSKLGMQSIPLSEDLDSNDTSSGMEVVPSMMAPKRSNKDATPAVSQDEDSTESLGRKSSLYRRGNAESSLAQNNGNALRGQRSKRKKHHALELQRPLTQEMDTGSEEDGEILDDSRILQKLGRDAVGKKVEVLSRDGAWRKGRVMETRASQSQYTVRFEDGKSDSIEFGKRRVRILSHFGKHGRS
ncbi:hypothetical protein GOP47_0017882 [Adiantum capillus-veneris]|uniref:PHD-type domain-containing protein n=1 Tax=Adiantum capillus-veneris TaxID=13818 RepID=A0A9D4UG90_ADICA|nr:hypothetical protein GOP47_0017882 [Adiantum capillus-veneris]